MYKRELVLVSNMEDPICMVRYMYMYSIRNVPNTIILYPYYSELLKEDNLSTKDTTLSSLIPRPHPLFNVAHRKRGEPGSRSHVHDIYVEGWWKGDYFAWAGDLFACNIEKWVWPGNEANSEFKTYWEPLKEDNLSTKDTALSSKLTGNLSKRTTSLQRTLL